MYSIEWEFLPAAERLDEFLAAYGTEGAWVALFRRGQGYIGTELLPVAGKPGWFRTVDRWQSAQAYAEFRQAFATEYAALDRACEAFTLQEMECKAGA